MVDEANSDSVREKAIHAYAEKAQADFKPHVMVIAESLERCMKLVMESNKAEKEIASEILRAVVVLNHAYLEDFMRTLVLAFLPTADEEALDGVPLVGSQPEKAQKFSMGQLARHNGKSVDDVIRESVSAYLERSTFNSVSEIVGFLKRIGLKLPDGTNKTNNQIPELPVTPEVLSLLDGMIQRRHHIVHRADKAKGGGGLQAISFVEVMGGIAATMTFTMSTAHMAFMKRHSFEEFEKKVDEMMAAYKKASKEAGSDERRNAADC
jgi:hypothetical protein